MNLMYISIPPYLKLCPSTVGNPLTSQDFFCVVVHATRATCQYAKPGRIGGIGPTT